MSSWIKNMSIAAKAILVLCVLAPPVVAQSRYRGEDLLTSLDPSASPWQVSFEKDPGGLRAAVRTGMGRTPEGHLRFRLPAEENVAVGISTQQGHFDLSRFEEIHLWVAADSVIRVQPFSQTSGYVFRDGGHPDALLPGDGTIVRLRIRSGSMADPAMVETIGLQVRPGTGLPVELRLIAITATARQSAAIIPRLALVVPAAPPSGALHNIYTVDFDLTRTYENPYDPGQIDVQAKFIAPSGKECALPAFWFQDYTVVAGSERYEQYVPAGGPRWRVRYLPLEEGRHTLRLTVRDGSGSTDEAGPFSFEVAADSAPGPVRRHLSSPFLLQYANGALYFPIGHNLAFEDGNPDLNGTAYYRSLLPSFATSGENWTRLWMTDFSRTALEWGSGHFSGFYQGVGTYSQRAAWRVDQFMQSSLSGGIQVQLVINDHGQFSSWVNERWSATSSPTSSNAYNSLAGGPVPDANPERFFSDSAARAFFRRRLRYLIARWSAYPNLLAWELFNEVQYIGSRSRNMQNDAATRTAVADWHREMADLLKAQDPFGHLVSTSSDESGLYGFPSIWNLTSIDLVQSHHYGQPPATRDKVIRQFVDAAQLSYRKPVIIGETGVKASLQPENHFDPTTFLTNSEIPASERTAANRDHMVAGTTLRNALWAAACSRSGAMNWWWGSYLAPDPSRHRQEPDFPLHAKLIPALVAFWGGEDLADPTLQSAALQTSGQILAYGLQSAEQALLWVRDSRNAYGSGSGPATFESRNTEGASVSLTGLNPGQYVVSFYGSYDNGDLISQSAASVSGGVFNLALPAFQGDIAVKIARGTVNSWGAVPRCAKTWIAGSDAADFRVGYAALRAVPGLSQGQAGAVLALADGKDLVSELTVPASAPSKSFWTVAEIGAPSETGLALVNTGAAAATVELRITDGAGSAAGSKTITLAPGEHTSRFLVQWLGPSLAPFRGVLEVRSDQALAALALRGTNNDLGQFIMTSIPARGAEGSGGSQTLLLPQVVDGGGYQTEWLFLNPTDAPLSGKVRFIRSNGSSWPLTVAGSTLSELQYRVPALGLVRWTTAGAQADVNTGYCVLEPDAGQPAPAGGAVIRYLPGGRLLSETGLPFLAASATGGTYWETGTGLDTGIAIANPADREQEIRLSLYQRSGSEQVRSAQARIPAGGHSAQFVTQLFPGLPPGSRGYLRISSDLPAGFLPLRMRTTAGGRVLFSSLMLNPLAGNADYYLPQIVYGGGFQTQFIVLNAADLTASGRMRFYSPAGNPSPILLHPVQNR